MSGFNQDSQMPEVPSGGDETATVTKHLDEAELHESQSTDRFGLEAAQKGWLLRRYNVEISKAGNPYFVPIPSLLKSYVAMADAALLEARARMAGSKELKKIIEAVAPHTAANFDARVEQYGQDRIWLARRMVIWPMTDQVGYHLYRVTSGQTDLADFGAYLVRTDANISDAGDLQSNTAFCKRQEFVNGSYDELAVADHEIGIVDAQSQQYNLQAIVAAGYRASASADTNSHLKGVKGNAPVPDNAEATALKADILAGVLLASTGS